MIETSDDIVKMLDAQICFLPGDSTQRPQLQSGGRFILEDWALEIEMASRHSERRAFAEEHIDTLVRDICHEVVTLLLRGYLKTILLEPEFQKRLALTDSELERIRSMDDLRTGADLEPPPGTATAWDLYGMPAQPGGGGLRDVAAWQKRMDHYLNYPTAIEYFTKSRVREMLAELRELVYVIGGEQALEQRLVSFEKEVAAP